MALQTWRVGSFADEAVSLTLAYDDADGRIHEVSYVNDTDRAAYFEVGTPGGQFVRFSLLALRRTGFLIPALQRPTLNGAQVSFGWPTPEAASRRTI